MTDTQFNVLFIFPSTGNTLVDLTVKLRITYDIDE